jgi:hypothetical protein
MINSYISNTGITSDILLYSITDDTIIKVSSLMTTSAGALAVQGNDKKYIYYFGGNNAYTVAQRFNTETNVTTILPTPLPSPILYASGVSKDGSIFIFNGKYPRTIMQFEEATEKARIIGDLAFQTDPSPVFSAAAIPNGGSVWLFAGNNPKPTNPILKFNTVDKTVSIPTGNANLPFPTLFENSATVTDGRSGYIIGGIGRAAERDGSYHPTNGILK